MCLTKSQYEELERKKEEREKSEGLQCGKSDEVQQYEHMPSSLPHEPALEEPALTPA